ncbi:hypothetical protein [Limosilactobacillus difficilis]|uniref:hypothetical protein n=1 Tax=Limosilactobacillus difficilis TaxID=2991838 RepID=UPI0024BA12A0|nr:hypothetical protein [Limosilactobacillus difficilis]
MHQTESNPSWFHETYDGEDRDDECRNELSIIPDQHEHQLNVLLTNDDREGHQYTNTFAFQHRDVEKLAAFLNDWLKEN